jgi:PAS domain S-box-containing protein
VLARDGQVRWAASQALVQRGPDGTPRRVTGIHQDVTEQRRAEAALRESEARFRALAETTPQLVWSADRHGVVDYVSPQCVAYTGIPAQRALAGGWREAVHPADRRRVAEAWRAAVRGGELFDIEYRVRRHDGEFRWFKARGAPMRDALGAVERWFGVATDIHDVVRAGEALRRSERRQRLMVHELNHRVKNTLATVQSLAAQSLRGAKGDEQAREVFEARLFALSRTHDVLTRENWDGAELRDIAAEAVAPYARDEAHRFLVEGPELRLAPATALALAMALHELATNAVKYGALSNETGRVIVIWGLGGPADARRLRLRWAETGGPPVHPPERRGFGSRLVERGLARELGGEVRLEFHESGVICDIDAPLTAAPELLQAAE